MSKIIRVGVVGYSASNFDIIAAWGFLKEGFDQIKSDFKTDKLMVISGLTDLGIPSLAYYIARQHNWNIGGIACHKASEYRWFPMSEDGDLLIIKGDNWGDESQIFLDNIDVLLRVGGGMQSLYETQLAHKRNLKVYEYDLELEEVNG